MDFKITTAILLLLTSSIAFATDWTLKEDQEGVKAFTRSVPNSDLLEFKGITEHNTSIDTILNLMQDVENYDKFLHTAYEPVLLDEIDTNTRIAHIKYSTPFITSDRDLVLKLSIDQPSPTTAIITVTSQPGYLEEVDGYVRIPLFNGKWSLAQIKDEVVSIEYEGSLDPGGSLPDWVANMTVIETPLYTLLNLKKYIDEQPSK